MKKLLKKKQHRKFNNFVTPTEIPEEKLKPIVKQKKRSESDSQRLEKIVDKIQGKDKWTPAERRVAYSFVESFEEAGKI